MIRGLVFVFFFLLYERILEEGAYDVPLALSWYARGTTPSPSVLSLCVR